MQEPIVEIHPEIKVYSIEDLEKILRVKRRQILNYSKSICECCWEPESVFKPSFGKFSERMLEEMRKLQYVGLTEYQKQCLAENSKPVHQIHSALVISKENAIANLDAKIAGSQQEFVVRSSNLAEMLKAKLAEIAQENQSNAIRTEQISEAQKLAADNRGVQAGIEIYARELAAKNATIAQLKAMELQNG